MKRGILVGTLALILSIGGLAFAQGPGMMGGGYGGGSGWNGGYGMGPGMMGQGWGGGYGMDPAYGGGYGMGPGMMGGGYGGNYCPNCGAYQGPRGGYGMGPGMMGQGWGGGYGMGHGMMGGYGMGPGMMGQGWGARQGYGPSEECQKYFDESAGMRKELNNKRFEYFEALRNPKTKPEEVPKLEKDIWELQKKIYSNAPTPCR